MENPDDLVVLVDENDNETGTAGKLEAHRKALLHRAFSVFVLNSKGELMLQKRAITKYHSGGLWSNTCCSHPYPGEPVAAAAQRRLMEEMGFECRLDQRFAFVYRAELDNDLVEHEYDHVFIGHCDRTPDPNPLEVEDWKWMGLDDLKADLEQNPSKYSTWLRIVFTRIQEHIKSFSPR